MNTFSVYMVQGWASQAISRVESNPSLFPVLSSRVESTYFRFFSAYLHREYVQRFLMDTYLFPNFHVKIQKVIDS